MAPADRAQAARRVVRTPTDSLGGVLNQGRQRSRNWWARVRIARFSFGDVVAFGVVEGDPATDAAVVVPIKGHPFAPIELGESRIPLSQVRLLAPVLPSKVVAIGKNYADHVAEMGGETPPNPVLFLKPSTSVVGPSDKIALPHQSDNVHHEAELAVVIGRLCKDVPLERAHEVVLGYTCANDVTARDLQKADGQWARAKGFDTFCPIGPWVETDLDPADLAISASVGGEVRQDGRTSAMIRDVATLVAYVSQGMTLLPGDVILTGTPAGVGPIVHGDTVSVSIEGIGTLTNEVVSA
jgi:2-keto-4-pentenoate hydratase/2-oxohepta-3-ene-1,7-dioic acid hydratase in catechol pathway